MGHLQPTQAQTAKTEPIDRKSISVREVVSWAALPALAVASWGFGIAWSHEARIGRTETVLEEHQKSDNAKDTRLRDDLTEIKSTLRDQSAKLDALRDRIK